jgi:cytochrome c553
MKIKNCPISVFAGLMLMAAGAQGESLVDGDVDAGKSKSTTCSACHGADGRSMSPLWPNLAGQSATYIVAQLKAFKGNPEDPDSEPLRYNELMSPQSMALSEQDMKDLAVYYESQPHAVQAVANPDLLERGEALWRGGNSEKGVAACIACHGPTGQGNPAAVYPMLAGQHAAYTEKTLNDYASGARKSSRQAPIMPMLAERLTKEDIKALASYIQGLKAQ